jgi:hypothetical protein
VRAGEGKLTAWDHTSGWSLPQKDVGRGTSPRGKNLETSTANLDRTGEGGWGRERKCSEPLALRQGFLGSLERSSGWGRGAEAGPKENCGPYVALDFSPAAEEPRRGVLADRILADPSGLAASLKEKNLASWCTSSSSYLLSRCGFVGRGRWARSPLCRCL